MALAKFIPVAGLKDLDKLTRSASDREQAQPIISALSAHVRRRWEVAKRGKRMIEEKMLKCLRQRKLQYDPDKLAEIKKFGGSEIYMGIADNKARAMSSWLRDAMLGAGKDKPWTIEATPMPDLPDQVDALLQKGVTAYLTQLLLANQVPPTQEELTAALGELKDRLINQAREEARKRVERMEQRMEDQLIEGGFREALAEFIEDLVTYPFAVLKGPIVRKRKTLKWVAGGLVPVDEFLPEWERVDPFKFYWAPWAKNSQDGFIIEHHRLTREDLESMIGVEGYSSEAIRTVLMDFSHGRLVNWLDINTQAVQESTGLGDYSYFDENEDVVDALQLWDTIPGRLLIEWGMKEEEIDDPDKVYPCEVWLIGNTIIKATLNYDPLGRKPYYVTSIEKIPGSLAGNGVCDLVRDAEAMCNGAARALSNNMGLASGPMCYVNISRLPPGEDITQMYPWKIWQITASDYNDGTPPISFFQPNSNAQELMAVYEKFSQLADDISGIPRYMVGAHTPGVGRTSSGLSMLISNASKVIKQVISNIDTDIIVPVLERLYSYNLRYSQDPDLIGDVKIVPMGAMSLVVKEAEAVRRNEFLQIVLNSPLAQQIVGLPGAAELLRDAAKNLNTNVDKIVPPREVIEAQIAQQAALQQAALQQAQTNSSTVQLRDTLPDGSIQGGRDNNYVSSRVKR